jgi:hypothetical protein
MSENEIYCSVNAKRSQQLIVYSLLPFDGIIIYKNNGEINDFLNLTCTTIYNSFLLECIAEKKLILKEIALQEFTFPMKLHFITIASVTH